MQKPPPEHNTRHTQSNRNFNSYYAVSAELEWAHRTSFRVSRTVAQRIHLVRCYGSLLVYIKSFGLCLCVFASVRPRAVQLLDRHNPIGRTQTQLHRTGVFVCGSPFISLFPIDRYESYRLCYDAFRRRSLTADAMPQCLFHCNSIHWALCWFNCAVH